MERCNQPPPDDFPRLWGVEDKLGLYIPKQKGVLALEADKNHLIVDEYAADIVRDIFSWKLEGMSPQDIATRLNHNGVLSPMEYKKSLGMKFATSFKANPQAVWSAKAVHRILKNPVYTGVLIQGKETTLIPLKTLAKQKPAQTICNK